MGDARGFSSEQLPAAAPQKPTHLNMIEMAAPSILYSYVRTFFRAIKIPRYSHFIILYFCLARFYSPFLERVGFRLFKIFYINIALHFFKLPSTTRMIS